MKKFKKIISLVAATAMSLSAFAGFTVNAAVGDELMSQNFDAALDGTTEPWGKPSRTDKAKVSYPLVETLEEEISANKPAGVSGNVFNFSTVDGQNIAVKYDIAPELSAEADVYNVKFDVFVKNAVYGRNGNYGTPENNQYIFGFGTSTVDKDNSATATDMVEFRVEGSKLYYVSNGTKVDTGIDLGEIGKWISVDVTCDVPNHKFSGKLTSTVGDVCTIKATDFSNINATDIVHWYVASARVSGSEKGYVNNYLDNFVVTEAEAEQYADVAINYQTADGTMIKESYTDSAVVGSTYNVPDLHKKVISSDDETKYYEYVSGADEIAVAESGNEITLVFELKDKLAYEVSAVDENSNKLAVIASGFVIPGETVKAYADYAIVKDGVAYVTNETTVTYIPDEAEANTEVEYKAAESKNVVYDFENDVIGFTGNSEAATVAIADSTDTVVNADINGEKAMKFTATGGKETAYRTASLNVSPFTTNYETVVVNYDAYLTDAKRMTLNLLNAPISGYGDTGLFSIGVKDSGGFRVNGTQNSGANTWLHISVKADFANDKLYYTVTDAATNNLIASGSKDITAKVLQSVSFISWYETDSAYIDNIEVISTDRIVPDIEYSFEEDTESPLSNNDHAASAIVDSTDEAAAAVIDADLNGNKVLKFTADAETGESKQAVASLDISAETLGATEVTVDYDSYVNSNNIYFGIGADTVSSMSDEDIFFSHGYRTSKGYYVIYGESNSKYTAANGVWVHTKLVYNCDTGVLNYTISSPDGLTTYNTGKNTFTSTKVNKLFVLSWGADSVGYIDNITVTTRKNDVVDFEDGVSVFTADENSVAEVADTADINGTKAVKFTANTGVGDKIKRTEAVYDITDKTAGKANVVVSYDSYVAAGMRATINVGDFSQGYGKESYYIINGATGSGYTSAAGQWVHTVLDFDLNEGKYKYTVTSIADDSVYASQILDTDLASVDSIKFAATTENSTAYIDNITVTGLGTYVEPTFPKATLSYDAPTNTLTATTTDAEAAKAVIIVTAKDADGVLTSVKLYPVEYTNGVATKTLDAALNGNEVYLWSSLDGGMVPTAYIYTDVISADTVTP